MTIIHENNSILELNEAHSDNFILVIPKLPVAKFMSSVFNSFTSPNTTSTTGSSVCDDLNSQMLRREENLDLSNFKLFLKGVTLPIISIGSYEIGTQFATLNRASKISFTDLTTNMMVSENFLNYNMILYWMYALHNPEQYNKMSGGDMVREFFTDIYVIITNNHREKVGEYKFLDCFPTTLPSIDLTSENASKLILPVTWKHSGMFPSNNFILKYV